MSNWYVRKTGSDSNGGSSVSATPDASGSDGAITNASAVFTALSANFQTGDVGKGLNVNGTLYRIISRTSTSVVAVDRNFGSTASGQTWNLGGCLLTVGKLLQTTAAIMQNGDTLWIGAGTYRETLLLTLTAPTAETFIKGDIDGSHTGDSGVVVITAYTTNDKTAPPNTSTLSLNTSHGSFLTFQNLIFVSGGGTSSGVTTGPTSTNHDIKFLDCVFIAGGMADHSGVSLIRITTTFATATNITIDRCIVVKPGGNAIAGIEASLTTGVGADYDVNILIQNTLFLGGGASCVQATNNGTSTNKAGGVRLRNCTSLSSGTALKTSSAGNISTSIPCTVTNSFFYCSAAAPLNAGTLGQITEDYNVFVTVTARVNVTAGTHSISDGSYAPMVEWGQSQMYGFFARMLGVPMPGSPILGYGDDGAAPSYDLFNRPRPAGGSSASKTIGALERGNTFGKETGTVYSGTNAISITGPGYQDFFVPVDATATTVTVYMRYDSTYTGTRPQFSVLNGEECGVTGAIVTVTTSALNTWEQETLTFTPTSTGIVTIRVQSNDTNGGGKVFADSFGVS